MSLTLVKFHMHFARIISPPENYSFRKDFCFTHDVFFHSRNLRDAWADRREILHDGQ